MNPQDSLLHSGMELRSALSDHLLVTPVLLFPGPHLEQQRGTNPRSEGEEIWAEVITSALRQEVLRPLTKYYPVFFVAGAGQPTTL